MPTLVGQQLIAVELLHGSAVHDQVLIVSDLQLRALTAQRADACIALASE